MQVDLRDAYGLAALAALESDPDLVAVEKERIANPGGFFRSGAQGRLHYAWSRREVGRMLREHTLADFLANPALVD